MMLGAKGEIEWRVHIDSSIVTMENVPRLSLLVAVKPSFVHKIKYSLGLNQIITALMWMPNQIKNISS